MAEQNADMIKITTSARRAVNSNESKVFGSKQGRRPHPAGESKWKSVEGKERKERKRKKEDGPVD